MRYGGGEAQPVNLETSVRIQRPIEEVFDHLSDPGNFPHRNSAVRDVHATSASTKAVGSTYSMERELPSGSAANELEIMALERPRRFAIRSRGAFPGGQCLQRRRSQSPGCARPPDANGGSWTADASV